MKPITHIKPISALFTALLVLVAVNCVNANLVVNGDFNSNADGWTLINHQWANWQSVGQGTAINGGWDGSPGWFFVNDVSGRLPETSQLVSGLQPSATYRISGYYARDTANHTGNPFRVLVNGTEYFAAGGPAGVWTPFSFTFVASSNKCLLTFRSQVTGDDAYGIDHISMSLAQNALSITSVQASQRASSSSVDVYYTLSATNSGTSTVGLQVSTNGGATFNITPSAGTLTGDVGAGIALGSRKLTWDAAQTLPAGFYGNNVKVRITASGALGTATGTSSGFTVDLAALTRGIAVSGRVLDAASRAPVSGAAVSLAGQNTSSSGAGLFSFASVSSSGSTLTVSKSGYATYTGTVPVPAGASSVTLPDILLPAAPVGNKPVVTKVEPRLTGLFLSGVTLNNDFIASVDWNGVTPGYVRFSVNGTQVSNQTGNGLEYVASLNMGSSPFSPSFNAAGNRVTVQAVGNGGEMSNPFDLSVGILPLPDPIKLVMGQGFPFTTYLEGHIGLDFELPNPPVEAVLNLPVIGKFGFAMAANASFDYTITDGAWEAAIGVGAEGDQGKRGRRPSIPGLTRNPKMKLYVGNKEISGKIEAGARGTATFQSGITFDEVFGHGEIQGILELGRFGLLDLMGPGLSSSVGAIPGLGDATKLVSVIIYAIPGIDGEITFALDPQFAFDELELTGKIGMEAAYEPDLGVAEMRLYIGGEPSVTFGYPGELFRQVRFKVYAGAEFKAWVFRLGPFEYVFVDVSVPSQAGAAALASIPRANGDTTQVVRLKAVGSGSSQPNLMARDYLSAGPERFLLSPPSMLQRISSVSDPLTSFRRVGRTSVPASAKDKSSAERTLEKVAKAGGPEAGAGINQAELALVENVFPGSNPEMAAKAEELMLLYVADNGAANTLQATDIRWTRFDGTNWSVPATIHTNTQAEFAPQVAYDGNGDAIAVWERVADPNFNTPDLAAMAAEMEIVWAKWNHSTAQWSKPLPLTSNGHLDHAPLLCGPLADGSVLATWTVNTANHLMGTNGAGSQVRWVQWNPASQSWSSPQTLLSDVRYRLSQSLSGVSNLVVYAWSQDLDGNQSSLGDQQVFYRAWNYGVWGPTVQFTADAVGNRNARVSVAADGHTYLVWQRGTNLVLSQDFAASYTPVRPDCASAGFADYALTAGPAGNLAVLWQDMAETGSDAHYRVLDPASATWSQDALMFNDSPLERSFAPVWDDVGNLTVAYNKVQIIFTNKTVELEGGGMVTITNVPQPGRVDLFVTKRALVKDLALKPGDFTASAENYLPGAAVTLSATVRNLGDLAVSDTTVAFYAGNPTNGGVLITNVTIAGWLEGAATNTVSALWVVPDPATNHVLYAVADPAGAVTEFDETNNRFSLSLGGADLAVSLVSHSAETNGAVRVIAQVQNLGAPSATESVLAIRRAGETNAPLAIVAVPLLEPGRLATVALDLPAGTQPEGEAVYRLFADETKVVSDVDTNNNTTAFAVNLWVDSDGDGIPDSFENQYSFLDPNDPNDALLDYDEDGVSNLAEYLAGTALDDPLSYLRLTSITAGGSQGVEIAWGSAPNKLYTVQRSAVLGAGFTNLVEHIQSTPPENVYLDTTATNAPAWFYRIKVE